ncbi:MAG TPA: M1 family aminopeptidase [Caulobacteraceae bacterium]|jgi:aminopeptidase N
MADRFNRRQTLVAAVAASAVTAFWRSASATEPQHLLDPGISRALADHRSATLSDVRYAIALDLTQGDSAKGAVRMSFRRQAGAGDLIVDFRGPALTGVRANDRVVEGLVWRDGHFIVPARYLNTGVNRLEAEFTTPIAASGASIIRFDDKSDGATYLYTLLVPSDANLLFPCFDQPNLKARITWTLRAPSTWTVLANAVPHSRIDDKDGASAWRFAETEPIPTYLAAFGAGPWATWTSAPPNERPTTLYARASRRAEVDADTIIASNRDAAKWLADWFGVPFPFSKLDALLAPAFPFGGMEHVGEIFYNENSFVFREPPTPLQLLARDSTIYHEVSHQWFGDLVTMQWFDDLWLKEGFATYMAARVQDALKPQSETWKTFYLHQKPIAYAADSTRGTNSVSQPLDNLDQAKSNYGPIVYNKAPSIIKQLAFLVGEERFRAGLHRFLKKHAYANATWRDLLSAIEGDAKGSLQRFGDQFILRAGMPRVDTALTLEGGNIRSLTLAQRPVRDLPGDPGGWWPIKTQVRLGYSHREDVVLTAAFAGETVTLDGASGLPTPDYVWANGGDYGYGLFLPDARSAAWIEANVGAVKDGLLRAMLWGALWDLVRETRLAPARFCEIAMDALAAERDEHISVFILNRAATALTRYVSDADAGRLFPRWEALLTARAQDTSLTYGFRKESLDTLIATARTAQGRATLRSYLSGAILFDGGPVKQLTHWNIAQRLLALGEPDGPALVAAEAQRDTTPESGRSAFVVGAAAPTAEVKRAYYDRYFNDASLNEEWVSASLANFNDLDQAALSAPYLRQSLDRLPWIQVHRRIFFLPGWINAFIGGQQSEAALRTVDGYLADNPALPIDLKRKVLEARDDLARVIAIRCAAGAAV